MGLSVLIPVFNYPVLNLVQILSTQLERSGRVGEIIVYEDGSHKYLEQNLLVENYFGVSYFHESVNKGRMGARQQLVSKAKFDFLLFVDADSEITDPDFLSRYFDEVDNRVPLVSGGRIYSEKPPKSCEHRLHWKYGRLRETHKGSQKPAFMSNNFMVFKDLFNRLGQSVKIEGYGHEDTWWGMQFENEGVAVRLIDNPVLHGSLETSQVFITKAGEAVSNILELEKVSSKDQLQRHIKIYRWYLKLKKTGLTMPFLLFEKGMHNKMRKNLLSCNPNLFYFDCYRLALLIRLSRGHHRGASQITS